MGEEGRGYGQSDFVFGYPLIPMHAPATISFLTYLDLKYLVWWSRMRMRTLNVTNREFTTGDPAVRSKGTIYSV